MRPSWPFHPHTDSDNLNDLISYTEPDRGNPTVPTGYPLRRSSSPCPNPCSETPTLQPTPFPLSPNAAPVDFYPNAIQCLEAVGKTVHSEKGMKSNKRVCRPSSTSATGPSQSPLRPEALSNQAP